MFRLMKSKKSKLSEKLGTLKKKESAQEINVLDEEISFDNEDKTQAMSPDGESTEASDIQSGIHTTRVISNADSTAVIGKAIEHGERSVTHVTNSDSGTDNESTYREITAGRHSSRDTEKVSYGDVYEVEDSGANMEVGGLLKQVEHLRLAQDKINDLETEIEDLRRENDELLSAADTFRTLSEDYAEQIDKLKVELVESRDTAQQENRILKETLMDREKQNYELKQSNADLKSKVETNFKQIRKRERDLEYRLEMAKVEETTLLKTKDKSILELRRKIDKLEQEMEAYRDKNKEHYQKLQQQQQTVRGVVRALRIALTRLEGDFGVDFEVLKKAE